GWQGALIAVLAAVVAVTLGVGVTASLADLNLGPLSDVIPGDSSGQSAGRSAITATVTEVLTGRDSAHICSALLTPQFVGAYYTNQKTCAAVVNAGGDIASAAKLSDVKVEGDSASATVAVTGSSIGGSSGTWRFQRDAGEWRVSEWSTGYLRSAFRQLLGPNYY